LEGGERAGHSRQLSQPSSANRVRFYVEALIAGYARSADAQGCGSARQEAERGFLSEDPQGRIVDASQEGGIRRDSRSNGHHHGVGRGRGLGGDEVATGGEKRQRAIAGRDA